MCTLYTVQSTEGTVVLVGCWIQSCQNSPLVWFIIIPSKSKSKSKLPFLFYTLVISSFLLPSFTTLCLLNADNHSHSSVHYPFCFFCYFILLLNCIGKNGLLQTVCHFFNDQSFTPVTVTVCQISNTKYLIPQIASTVVVKFHITHENLRIETTHRFQ